MIYEVKVKVKSLSHVQLFAAPWTVAYQASLSMGFSRPEYWSGLPFPSPGDRPHPGMEPRSPALQADALPWATREALFYEILSQKNSEEWLNRKEGKKANERRIFQQVTKVYNWSLRRLQKHEFYCEAQL